LGFYLILEFKNNIKLVDFNKVKLEDRNLEKGAPQIEAWGIISLGIEKYRKEGPTEKIKVAILDSGINKQHEDLINTVSKEYNAIEPGKTVEDDFGHGTVIAGVIAAQDNDYGIVGIAPNVDLYSVKILDDKGAGSIEALNRGIQWCIDNKVQIINLSFGTSEDNTQLQNSIKKAIHANILVVAASGNKFGLEPDYPAKYEDVFSVTAVNKNYKVKPRYSATGKVDYSLPGISVLSTSKDGGYAKYSGTSLASAHLTGILALILENHVMFKIDLNEDKLRQKMIDILKDYSIDLGEKSIYGNGFIKLS